MSMESNAEHIEKTKEYYDRRFGHGVYKVNPSDLERFAQIEKRIKRLNKTGAVSILDAGCGSGWLSSLLSAYGEVTGIDISPMAIEAARVHYPGIRFICMNAVDGFPLQEKFDIIVSSEVIEHIAGQEKYFNNIASLLKTDGTLILTTPNGKWKKPYFTGYRKEWAQAFEFWLTAKELKELAKPHFKHCEVKSFYSQWFLLYNATVFYVFAEKVLAKVLKSIWLYRPLITWLNNRNFGIYLIMELKN